MSFESVVFFFDALGFSLATLLMILGTVAFIRVLRLHAEPLSSLGIPARLRHLPHFFVITILNLILAPVTLLRLALRRPIVWKIYEK